MAVGLNAANLANKWLDVLSNTTFTGLATTAVKLHIGDPGANGTGNPSAETTRKALTWNSAASGSKSITATLPQWTSWSQGSETLSHASVWDSTTAGNFLYSFAFTLAKPVSNSDTVNITAHSISLTPIAA